jgi:hypothetical protein
MRFDRWRLSGDNEAAHRIEPDGRACYSRNDGLDGLNVSQNCDVACGIPLAQPNAAALYVCYSEPLGSGDCVTQCLLSEKCAPATIANRPTKAAKGSLIDNTSQDLRPARQVQVDDAPCSLFGVTIGSHQYGKQDGILDCYAIDAHVNA